MQKCFDSYNTTFASYPMMLDYHQDQSEHVNGYAVQLRTSAWNHWTECRRTISIREVLHTASEKKQSMTQLSRMILYMVNEALSILKKKPNGGERLYDLIYFTYIAPETLSHNEVLYRLNLSSRHYYRLREQAIYILSIRLWSAPNKDIEFWLELISTMGDDK